MGLCTDRVPISGLHHNRVVFAIICLIEAERRAILQPCTYKVREAYVCYGGRLAASSCLIFFIGRTVFVWQVAWENEAVVCLPEADQKKSLKKSGGRFYRWVTNTAQ